MCTVPQIICEEVHSKGFHYRNTEQRAEMKGKASCVCFQVDQ